MRIKKQKLPYMQVFNISAEFPTFFSPNGTFHWLVSRIESDSPELTTSNSSKFDGLIQYPKNLAATLQTMKLNYMQAHVLIRHVQNMLRNAIIAIREGIINKGAARKVITKLFTSGRDFYSDIIEKESFKNAYVHYDFGKNQPEVDDATYLSMVRDDLPPAERDPKYSNIVSEGRPHLQYAPNGNGDYSHVLFSDMKNSQVEFGWNGNLSSNIIYATLAANINRIQPGGPRFDISINDPADEFVTALLGALFSLAHTEPPERLACMGNLRINGRAFDWRTLCAKTSKDITARYAEFKYGDYARGAA
jgi:hypothetical protein